MTDPGGLVPGYFSEYTEDQTATGSRTVYAISYTNNSDSEIVYDWEYLRPLTTGAGDTIYSVADDGIDGTHRRIVEKALEGGAYHPLFEGADIVVPIHSPYGGIRSFRVRKTVILLPVNASA